MPKSDEKKMGIREIRLIRGNRDKEGGLRENSAIALGRCHFSLAASAPLVYDVENRCDYPLLRRTGARAKPEPRPAAAGWVRQCRRVGLSELGRVLHETRGSLSSELGSEAQIKVEEDCHDFA